MKRQLRHIANAVGRGLLAGLAGTAAMTVTSTLEARLRDRSGSDVPARGLEAVVGADGFVDEAAKQRTNRLVPWAYGTALGGVRGLLDVVGIGRNLADVAFHGVAFGAEQALLPALDLAPPITRWRRSEIVSDVTQHTVYSLATNGTYRWLAP